MVSARTPAEDLPKLANDLTDWLCDDPQSGEPPQNRSENRTCIRSRQGSKKRGRNEGAENHGAADPDREADVIQEIDRQIHPVRH